VTGTEYGEKSCKTANLNEPGSAIHFC